MGARCGCVCLGSGFGCAPPLLARVLGCVWAGVRALLAPRRSWLWCAVWLCGFGRGLRLRPATPSCSVGMCVFVCVLRLHLATTGTGARCGCVCFGSGSGCAPPLLAGVFGCVCARVRAPLALSHSWHGCAVWVRVFGLGFRLRPATAGSGVGLCVGSCARSACTPPLLAGVRVVGVCVWALVSAAPRHSSLGCWGLRVCVCAQLAPSHSLHGCAVWVCVFGLRFRLRPAKSNLKPQTSTTARACDGSFITFAITLQFVSNRRTSSPSCWLLPFNAILVSACLHAHEGTS